MRLWQACPTSAVSEWTIAPNQSAADHQAMVRRPSTRPTWLRRPTPTETTGSGASTQDGFAAHAEIFSPVPPAARGSDDFDWFVFDSMRARAASGKRSPSWCLDLRTVGPALVDSRDGPGLARGRRRQALRARS